jgi:hypothetical protein
MCNIFYFLYDKESLWRPCARVSSHLLWSLKDTCGDRCGTCDGFIYEYECVFTIRTYVLRCKYIYILSARILTKTCSVLSITDSNSVFGSRAARSQIRKNEEINLFYVASVDAFCKYTTKTEEANCTVFNLISLYNP